MQYELNFISGPRKAVVDYSTIRRPFNNSVWFLLYLSVIFVLLSLVWIDFYYVSGKIADTQFDIFARVPMMNKFMGIIGILLFQPQVQMIKFQQRASVVTFVGFMLATMIIGRAYRGQLLASLAHVNIEPKLETSRVSHS